MILYDDASLLIYPSGYKASKIYSLKPTDGTGDLSFARSSSATRVNEDGLIDTVSTNVPRIDYTGGGCGKLLIEPQRTNTVRSNSDYMQTWANANVLVTANATTSPNGSNYSQKLTSANTFGQHYIRQILGGHTVGAPHVYSCFAKADELDILTLRLLNGGGPNVNFDLTNGTHNGGVNGKMIDFGNGWYRCIAYHPSSSSQYLYPYIYTQVGNTQGDGVSGLYVYGAMIEEGDYETSLINTTTTSVTRVADTSSTTGLSSVIGQTEGVLFAEIAALANDGTNRAMSISDGTNNNQIVIRFSSTSNQITSDVTDGGVITANLSSTLSDALNYNKIALKYKVNDVALWVNGVEVANDTSATMPSGLDEFKFSRADGASDFYGKLQKLQLFPSALTDAELATLTTI